MIDRAREVASQAPRSARSVQQNRHRAFMRETYDASQAIADKHREMKDLDGLTRTVDGLMGAERR
jgi:hypothetical protein